VSELIDTFDATLSLDEVKAASTQHVDDDELMGWEQTAGSEMWTALNAMSARFWTLRKHEDAWALCCVLARISGQEPGHRSEQLAWADAALQRHYTMPSVLSLWQPGPTFATADTQTFYCSVPRASLTPIPRTSVIWHAGGGMLD
jgi:hypothetical protein